MRKTTFIIYLIGITVFIFQTKLNAQKTIPASGGDATSTSGSVSYSVGQVFYTTNTGDNGSVAQGVQQPYEISIIDGIEEASNILLNCSAYPNPTTDILVLKVESYDLSNLSYKLYNLGGQLLDGEIIISNETSLSLLNQAPGTYILKILDSEKEVKTFKIVKR